MKPQPHNGMYTAAGRPLEHKPRVTRRSGDILYMDIDDGRAICINLVTERPVGMAPDFWEVCAEERLHQWVDGEYLEPRRPT